tara:strand:+ start:103 stop:366 length:264 start_codon:yes stop_codon:yes gene_type:complete
MQELEVVFKKSKEDNINSGKRWAIKEEKSDGSTWWMIRGGAFSNVINTKYNYRLFESKDDAIMQSNDMNRLYGRKTTVAEVRYKNAK